MSEQPALVELCSEYAASLAASRRPTDSHLPYGWHEAFPGVVLCRELRRFFHAELVRAAGQERAGWYLALTPVGAA